MNVEIETGPGVLVPRSETELLGYAALDLIADVEKPIVVDMCCGSGNLALAIAVARPAARVSGSDLTREAVTAARANIVRLGLQAQVEVHQGDMFEGLAGLGLQGIVDLVVCNPPYISTAKLESDKAYLLNSEPREAFDAGPYGIAIHLRLVAEAIPYLRRGGWIAFEFGTGQERQAKALLARSQAYSSARFFQNAEGAPRVAIASKL